MVEPSYCEGNQSGDSSHHSLQSRRMASSIERTDLVSVDLKDLWPSSSPHTTIRSGLYERNPECIHRFSSCSQRSGQWTSVEHDSPHPHAGHTRSHLIPHLLHE